MQYALRTSFYKNQLFRSLLLFSCMLHGKEMLSKQLDSATVLCRKICVFSNKIAVALVTNTFFQSTIFFSRGMRNSLLEEGDSKIPIGIVVFYIIFIIIFFYDEFFSVPFIISFLFLFRCSFFMNFTLVVDRNRISNEIMGVFHTILK